MMSFLVSIFQLHAQEPSREPDVRNTKKSPTERSDEMLKQCQSALSLNDEQSVQMKEVLYQMEIYRENEIKNRQEQKRKTEEALSRILTPDQMTAFRKIMSERRSKMEQRRGKMPQE